MEQFLAYRRTRIWVSNTLTLWQSEKYAKHPMGKTAQQIGADVGEAFQQVNHSCTSNYAHAMVKHVPEITSLWFVLCSY